MNRRFFSKRDFTLRLIQVLTTPLMALSAQAQVKVIGSNGEGLEGEITSTGPKRRVGNAPPPGSAQIGRAHV